MSAWKALGLPILLLSFGSAAHEEGQQGHNSTQDPCLCECKCEVSLADDWKQARRQPVRTRSSACEQELLPARSRGVHLIDINKL